jgi:hypothetical protein
LKSFRVAQGTLLGECGYVREARLSSERDNLMMRKERRERREGGTPSLVLGKARERERKRESVRK